SLQYRSPLLHHDFDAGRLLRGRPAVTHNRHLIRIASLQFVLCRLVIRGNVSGSLGRHRLLAGRRRFLLQQML
ncbi:hypothetical protein PFISCL1PPCAC_11374, partial [Pristionchus fissidentatus]